MAEVIARDVLRGRENITVSSAGVSAYDGGKATPEAVEAMQEIGLDLSGHRSRSVTAAMVAEADEVYTMTASHRRMLLDLVPEAELKVQRLIPGGDVADPVGGSLALYRDTAQQIRRALEERLLPAGRPG